MIVLTTYYYISWLLYICLFSVLSSPANCKILPSLGLVPGKCFYFTLQLSYTMVFLLKTLLAATKELRHTRKKIKNKFIDSVRLHVKGGTGGTGLPKYGGLGGQGGCVYCIGTETADLKNILVKYRAKTITAGHGEDSKKVKIVGSPGEDVKLEVPLGVTIYNEKGDEMGTINNKEETVILARGGPGGNESSAYHGHFGQSHHVRLDLKLIADVGLVGFPNAGKSSLLKAISRAKPRIADYPFTTLRPNIGMITFEDLRQISLADLPGLIEGAHMNIGLGHNFLRHVERTKLLLFVTDVKGFTLSPRHKMRTCLETVLLLNKEIELYNKELLEKPAVLAVNKMDLKGAQEIFEEVKYSLKNIDKIIDTLPEELRPEQPIVFEDIVGISAKNDPESVDKLKQIIRKRLDDYAEENNPDIVKAEDLFKKTLASIRERGPKLT